MDEKLTNFLNELLDTPVSDDEFNFDLAFIRKCDYVDIGNQNLAFLGDAVLSLIIREHSFKKYPDFNKGNLTMESVVFEMNSYLAKVGRELEIVKYLDFKTNHLKNPGRNDTVIAEAMEALFGAIYLHRGFEQAEKIAKKHILKIEEK